MKAKKLLAIFLALSMLLASVPAAGFTALAGTEEDLKADIWDGTVDTSWYDAANVATEYHFTTPEQLAGLAALVNLDTSPVVFSTSTTFYLDNDLYLNGISDYENWGTTPPQNNWIPIGDSRSANRFQGNFDGQGHTIYGMYCKVVRTTDRHSTGLFGCSKYGNIQNFSLRSARVVCNGLRMSSSVVGFKTNGGKVSNVVSDAAIVDTSDRLTSGEGQVGGIIGLISNAPATVEKCGFTGSIDYTHTTSATQALYIGGLIGKAEDIPTLTECYNTGSINAGENKAQTGGLIGRTQGNTDKAIKASRCYNTGSIIGGVDHTGGLFGYGNDTTSVITECYNTGDVTAAAGNTATVGGIFGQVKGKFTSCYNTGAVSNPGTGYAGGIGGYLLSAGSSINGVYNVGQVTGDGSAAILNIDDLGTGSANLYYLAGTAASGTVYLKDRAQNDVKWAAVSCAGKEALSDTILGNLSDAFAEDVHSLNNGLPVLSWQNRTPASAAAEVDGMIAALPAADQLTLKDTGAVRAARAAYAALSDESKALVTALSVLEAAESKIFALEKAAGFADLDCKDTANIASWSVQTNLQVGDQAYGDRSMLFFDDSLPEALLGSSWIRTAMNSKSWNAGSCLCSFRAARTSTLYVAWSRSKATPTWLQTDAGWEKLEDTITFWNSDTKATHDSVMQLYRRPVQAGDLVKLGILGTADAANYLVFLPYQFASADYTAVDAALEKATALKEDDYTAASWAKLQAAIEAVDRDLSADEQETVDGYAAAIEAAIAALVPRPADYTAVDAALEKAAALSEADYTAASWAKLQAAIEAVVRDLAAAEQETVDGYAAAIEAAISALIPKAVEMELTISTGMVTAAAAEGKYDITWNARILLGEELKVEDINEAGVQFKNYGVYYGTGKDVLNDYKNATADQIRQVVFDKGEDIDVYTAHGFRLRNVLEGRVRAAMFYVEYELNGQNYILLSTVDGVRAIIVG